MFEFECVFCDKKDNELEYAGRIIKRPYHKECLKKVTENPENYETDVIELANKIITIIVNDIKFNETIQKIKNIKRRNSIHSISQTKETLDKLGGL